MGIQAALWLLLLLAPTPVMAQGVGLLPTEGEPALAGKYESPMFRRRPGSNRRTTPP